MQNTILGLFDRYTLKARFMPGVFTLLPILLVVIAWFPDDSKLVSSLIGTIGVFGGANVVGQWGRDRGKKLEPSLFKLWGGVPSTIILRHRDDHLNPHTKKRYHELLELYIPDIRIPSEIEEQKTPDAADQIYGSCSDFLRDQSRDSSKYALLLAENINYGTRRNLYGLKPYGISLSLTTNFLLIGLLYFGRLSLSSISISCISINLLLLTWWLFYVSPNWIKMTAYAYAERLMEVCDQLSTNSQH